MEEAPRSLVTLGSPVIFSLTFGLMPFYNPSGRFKYRGIHYNDAGRVAQNEQLGGNPQKTASKTGKRTYFCVENQHDLIGRHVILVRNGNERI
jgi:hypothetical protein